MGLEPTGLGSIPSVPAKTPQTVTVHDMLDIGRRGCKGSIMALYSVWDWDRNSWRVYTTNASVSVGDDAKPPRPVGVSPVGADPDTQIKALPSGAKFGGHSHVARGEIRRMPRGLGDSGDDAGRDTGGGWLMFGLGAAAATAFWLWKKRRR